MNISKRIYNFISFVKGYLLRKSFKVSFGFFSTIIVFFFTFGTYAQEGLTEGISPAWEGTKCLHNTASGTECEEDNINSHEGLSIVNITWAGVTLMAPELTPNYEDIEINQSIPHDLKRGLLGMTTDASDALYANYPMINVSSHLAQQWVPGYKDGSTSIYAATGYEELSNAGITGLWTKSLNISYIVFVLIMIAAGFMIMFRNKLGGQTIVTLGNVLPRVIISLIIATFSFAIAGLIIDLGGILNLIIREMLGPDNVAPISTLGHIMKSVISGSFRSFTDSVISGLGIQPFLDDSLGGTNAGLSGIIKGALVTAIFASSPVLGAVGMFIVLCVVGIVLFGAIKVLITLFKAYFTLLITVILGPLQITLGAIPGNNRMITNWLLSIIRNVLVFPLVLFIINLPNAINFQGNIYLPLRLVGDFDSPNISPGWGALLLAIFRIFSLYFAAQAPKFLETWLPANTSPAFKEGMGNVKASMQKIPFVGGLFKG